VSPTSPLVIAADKVVELRMKLTDNAGEVLDEADADDPIVYLHGHENLVPGLEAALEGHAIGDKLQVIVPPEDGYGEHDGTEPEPVPRADLPDDIEIEEGMELEAEMEDGSVEIVYVTRVEKDEVYVDANHPLAGETLHFEVEVLAIRDADAEEIEHGHPHDPDDADDAEQMH